MTGPIVFHFKAVQLGVISPLSDYQWRIDREKDTLIKGHLNVSRCRVMRRNTTFKTQFGGKYPRTANGRHNMFTLLSANSLYRHIYGNGSQRNTKTWSYNSHQEATSPAKTQVNIQMLWFHTSEKKTDKWLNWCKIMAGIYGTYVKLNIRISLKARRGLSFIFNWLSVLCIFEFIVYEMDRYFHCISWS